MMLQVYVWLQSMCIVVLYLIIFHVESLCLVFIVSCLNQVSSNFHSIVILYADFDKFK